MPQLIDSHCHLADARLRDDVEGVIARAREAGVVSLISVGAIGPIENDRHTVALAECHAGIYAVIGLHPHDAAECDEQRIDELRQLAASPGVVAIGESGLDFHYTHSPPAAQEDSLRRQLALAAELDKPVVLHCRNAERQLAAIVRDSGLPQRGGLIHCFTGDWAAAREFLDLGFHLSFSGILTFRNAAELRQAAARVPKDSLMVETDAPYLAPEPVRGRRNEPAYVVHTLAMLAEVRGLPPEMMAAIASANTRRFFALP